MSKAETVGFAIHPADRETLDHLVEVFGGGNRSAFLREAIHVMAARERAMRLAEIQAAGHQAILAKFGRPLTDAERSALTRASLKGRLPAPSEMAALEPMIQSAIRAAALAHGAQA